MQDLANATSDTTGTLEQRQGDRGEAAASAQTCLVDPDKAPDRGSRS